MPVVEYKMHVVTNKGGATAPLWVDDGGYHTSPIDKTKIGWVLPEADRRPCSHKTYPKTCSKAGHTTGARTGPKS